MTALLIAAAPAVADTYIPGDLVIASTDQRDNETIDIVGSIIIENGGQAQWINVQVNFNSTAPDAHGLYIDGSATFDRVNITALPGTTLWWFKVNATGSLWAQSCDFGWMNGTGGDPGATSTAATVNLAGVAGGLQVLGGAVAVGNSSIHDGLGANVYIAGGSGRFDRDSIFDARYAFTEYATSYSAPRQTSDFRGVAVCVLVAGGLADLERDRIERCGAEGSANITDEGTSGATDATSNMRLVGAGVALLTGNHTLRQLEVQNITQFASSTRSFTLGAVAVTHNLVKLASWGALMQRTAGGEVSGGYFASADIGIEIFDDASYAGGAMTYDLHGFWVNGTYLTGVQAFFGGFASPVTVIVDSSTFAGGGSSAVNLQFQSLTAAHSATVTSTNIDLGTATGTGINIFDTGSSGKPTFTVSSNTLLHLRAPLSVGLQSLTGGASVAANGNFMDLTAGAQNFSAQPSTRGGIDLRWVGLSGGAVSVVVDNNRVYNQTWQVGPYDGITLYSSGSSNLPTSIAVRGNGISNVSSGLYVYEVYGAGQNAVYNVSSNTIEVTAAYGIYIYDNSPGGALDPALDWNYIDRAGSYAVYWQVTQAVVAQRTFGNNTVWGSGPSRCCGMYFIYQLATKWPLQIADTQVNNTSVALLFQQVQVNIFRTDVTGATNATTCQDCVAHYFESNVYALSAQVSGQAGTEVVAYQSLGAKRVQWQGDRGELIHDTVLQLDWPGPVGPQRIAYMPINGAGVVENRTLPAWKRTPILGDIYGNLTPSIRILNNDITGNTISFAGPFWGNITIIDPGLPQIIVISPGADTQVRTHSVAVSGTVSDGLTGVAAVYISSDGANFNPVSVPGGAVGGGWSATVIFPADGVYNITVRAWDVARFSITFGDLSTGYSELVIPRITVDTRPPRLQITDPALDITTSQRSYVVQGEVADLNAVAFFQFSFAGNVLPVQPDPIGHFTAVITGLAEGPNLISVLATDAAGNTNVTTRTIVLDTIPPVLIIYSPANNSFTNRAALEVTGEVEQDVVLEVKDVIASFPYALPLANGLNSIWVNATDKGGNQASVLIFVTLDRQVPSVTFTSPSRFPFYTRDPHVVVSGIANEPLGSLVVNDVSYPLAGTLPRNFTFELYLEDGQWDVLVVVTDLANNSLELRASPLIIDTKAPALKIDSPPDKSVTPSRTVTFRGHTDANAFLNVTSPSGRQPWDVNPVTGEFTFTDTRSTDGVFPYTFETSDAVGNVRMLTVTITVDTTKPNVEVLSPPANFDTEDEIVNFHGTVGAGAVLTVTVNSPDPALRMTDEAVAVTCSGPAGADCEYNFNLKVVNGQTTISLVATDLAGNQQAREVFVKRSVAAAQAPAQNGWMVGLLGLAAGLAAFPFWMSRFRRKANEAEPGLLAHEERPARSMMAAPAAPPVVIQEEPADMYATDAMARQPGRRPPREG